MDTLTKQIYDAIKGVDKNAFWDVFGDAHTIFMPSDFTELGLPENYIINFVYNYKSDGSYKGTIIDNDGKVRDEQKGVMSSSVASEIATRFKLEDAIHQAGLKNGRGFSLRIISDAIWKHVHEV